LYFLLGGSLRAIPLKEQIVSNTERIDSVEITTKFDSVTLPGGSFPLMTALEKFGQRVVPVVEYLFSRGDFYLYPDYESRFWWSPEMPTKLIIPFFHHDRVVGYMGRDIRVKGADPGRFVQTAASDYLFDQHRIRTLGGKYVFVMESPMSAIPLSGTATRANRLTAKQINFLKVSDKTPILIPDYKGEEWKPYLNLAEQEQWPVSTPNWPYKDVGEAMQEMGCLKVATILMNSMTLNYKMAELVIKKNVMVGNR